MYTRELARSLNAMVELHTGCKIGEQYITTDRFEFSSNYIPVGSLQPGKPVIISHYVGIRMIFIPHTDWDALNQRAITVEDYVNNSVWNYGYYWGINALHYGGVYWQPLENGKTGINDREKVRRYLTILRCRAHEKYRNESPMMIWCSDCYLEKCPMSVIHRKKLDASWEDEVKERNVRHELYEAVAYMLKERFDLEVCGFGVSKQFDNYPNNVYLHAGFSKGTVKLFISQAMFIDMMYRPEKYDVEKMLKNGKLLAYVDRYEKVIKDFVVTRTMTITAKTNISDLNEFWGKE